MIEQLDFFYPKYCDFANPEFLDALRLEESEARVLVELLSQHDPNNRCYMPDLSIEALIVEPATPYKAVRALHSLGKKRVIFYGLAEESHSTDAMTSAEVIDTLMERSLKDTDAPIEEIQPYSLGADMKREKQFERYAVLNIEYPIVYNCMQEESEFHVKWNEGDLSLLFTAIRSDRLGIALTEMGLPYMLEFLQYVQSLFNQPITELKKTDESPAASTGATTEEEDE